MKKKQKQLSNISLAYIAAGALLVAVMTLFGISAFLGVNSIIIEGINLYSPEQVAEASGVLAGNNLLYLSEKKIKQNIISTLPYVSNVSISRDLPDTLMIEVAESTAIAYMPYDGNALVIDSGGRVLDIVKMNVGSPVEIGGTELIEIRGIPISEAVLGSLPVVEQGSEMSFQPMRDILSAMERDGIARNVNYLDVASITNISFGFMNMYRIILGGLGGYRQKIARIPSDVVRIQEEYPNTRGVYNMTDPSGEYKYAPEQ